MERTTSVPTTETSLALTAVDFGGKYMQELHQSELSHSAHSGPISALSRGIGGPPGQAEVGCGSRWG